MRGYDAFLFASLALLIAALVFGRLAAIWVLLAGGIIGAANYFANLREISNSVSLWLAVQPPDLFFYAFLPPLLLDEALHLDFFLFRKIWVHAIMLAFVMVIISTVVLTPIILFALGFQSRGWSWVHGALFSAIIAPTDALAVAAILSQSNGPEHLITLVQSESLLNDASGITLYLVFSEIIFGYRSPSSWPSVWSVVPNIIVDIIRLSAVGIGIGFAMSVITGEILRWLRWRGARPVIETTLVLSLAYLTFYVTNGPAQGSGVIAVAVYGLYGNFKSKWGMLADAEESGAFDAVWDLVSFAANGLIFFWSGIASVNFTIRSVKLLNRSAWSYAAIPLIYIFMLLIRTTSVALFNPIFRLLGKGLSSAEILFVGWSGLRGGVSLIMVSAFTTGSMLTLNALSDAPTEQEREQAAVNADISLWTACFVVLTLVINGPGTGPLLRFLKLCQVPMEKLRMRGRAKRALLRFTREQVQDLRKEDNEFLQGADWEAIEEYVDMTSELETFDQGVYKATSLKNKDDSMEETEELRESFMEDGRIRDKLSCAKVLGPLWAGIIQMCGRIHGISQRSVSSGEDERFSQQEEATSEYSDTSISSNKDRQLRDELLRKLRGNEARSSSDGQYERDMKAWKGVSADELVDEMRSQVPFFCSNIPHDAAETHGNMLNDAQDQNFAGSENLSGFDDIETGLQDTPSTLLAALPEQHDVGLSSNDTADDDDQKCISGPAGAKLLSELQRTLSEAQPGGAATRSRGDFEPERSAASASSKNDSSDQEYKGTQVGTLNFSEQQHEEHKSSEDVGKLVQDDEAYYCSLPVLSRAKLQNELNEQVKVSAESSAHSLGIRNRKEAATNSPKTQKSFVRTGDSRRPRFLAELQSLKEVPFESVHVEGSDTLIAHASSTLALSREHSSKPIVADDDAYSRLEESENDDTLLPSHHATVSGVPGANLQAELRKYLLRDLRHGRSRDLLGRKQTVNRKYVAPATEKNTTGRERGVGFHDGDKVRSLHPARTIPAPIATALAKQGKRMREAYSSGMKSLSFDQSNLNGSDYKHHEIYPKDLYSSMSLQGAKHPVQRSHYTRAKDGSDFQSARSAVLMARTFSNDDTFEDVFAVGGPSIHDVGAAIHNGRKRSSNDKPGSENGKDMVGDNGKGKDRNISVENERVMDEASLMEMRIRLIAGLKRRFVAKRLSGLMSVQALRILQYACDCASEKDVAINGLTIWAVLEREVSGGWTTMITSRLSVMTTNGYRSLPKLLKKAFSWPYRKFAGLLRHHLGNHMLVACEVAVEYYLALIGSPQIIWLRSGSVPGYYQLLREIDKEAEAAHRFIIAREIEAPDRFGAIQSYRAAMAILKQQWQFTEELFEAGLIDAREHDYMAAPIERRLRQLEIVGPVWRPPRPKAVLRGLAFMSIIPLEEFERIWIEGSVMEIRPGSCFWKATDIVRKSFGEDGPGSYVILSGIVRRIYQDERGTAIKEYYQGTGSMVGVLLTTTGTQLPGSEMAIAEGNALGKGPVVFHVPQWLTYRILQDYERGLDYAVYLYENLLRFSAAYIVENMDDTVINAVAEHVIAVISNPAMIIGKDRAHNEVVKEGNQRLFSMDDQRHPSTVLSLHETENYDRQGEAAEKKDFARIHSTSSNLNSMWRHIAALECDQDDDASYISQSADESGGVDRIAGPSAAPESSHANRTLSPGVPNVSKHVSRESLESQGRPRISTKAMEQLSLADEKAPQLAADVLQDIRQKLGVAIPVELPAANSIRQQSHIVLVRGSLEKIDSSETRMHVDAPCVLPWLWDSSQLCNLCSEVRMSDHETWQAGSLGAVLVVCPHPDGSVPSSAKVYFERQRRRLKQALATANASSSRLSSGHQRKLRSHPVNNEREREIFAEQPMWSCDDNGDKYSNADQGSVTGRAAAVLGRELSGVLKRLRSND